MSHLQVTPSNLQDLHRTPFLSNPRLVRHPLESMPQRLHLANRSCTYLATRLSGITLAEYCGSWIQARLSCEALENFIQSCRKRWGFCRRSTALVRFGHHHFDYYFTYNNVCGR